MFRYNLVVNYRCIAILPALLSCGTLAYAAENPSHYQASVYLGGTSTTIAADNVFMYNETDSLVANHTIENDFSWGAGLAYHSNPSEWIPINNLLDDVSLGVDFFYFQTHHDGVVWQFQQAQFNNFSYSMPVTSSRLLVDSEWTFKTKFKKIAPFIEGGIGLAANTASFSETPIPGYNVLSLTINSNTQYQFAYTVGAGLKYALRDTINLSARYLYANLGNANSNGSGTIRLLSPLQISLTTQAWLAGVSYLF